MLQGISVSILAYLLDFEEQFGENLTLILLGPCSGQTQLFGSGNNELPTSSGEAMPPKSRSIMPSQITAGLI